MSDTSDTDERHDPTYRKAVNRELRQQGQSCRTCRHNITEGRRRCEFGNRAWPDGPCSMWEEWGIIQL